MKKSTTNKLTIVITACLLFSTVMFSQQLINKQEITPKKLSEIFKNAYVEVVSVQDTYIKVKDLLTSYIDIDAKKRYISISGNYSLRPNTPKIQILELINKINREVILIKCFYKPSNNSINYIYYYWIEGGFTDKSLIKAFKIYNSALSLSLQKDINKIIK